jgi:peptidoglycan/xylan/chitin deacetylase (PgdA/CDA1 family)
MSRALILVYHDIAPGPKPLCLPPAVFRAHIDCLAECGATPLTVSALARGLRGGSLPPLSVCVTFDDGFASVVDEAAPQLLEHGIPATIFCVAGYLGRTNGWPSQPAGIARRALAAGGPLGELASAGFELGSHGYAHAPLARASPDVLVREVVDARRALEQALSASVETFAYPYGALPAAAGRALVRETYVAACAATPRTVTPDDDLVALPRVDAHYLRRPALLRRLLLGGGGGYLALRRAGRRLRGLAEPLAGAR